jgi:MFS family permease
MTQSSLQRLYTRQFLIIWVANFFSVISMSTFFLFPLFITARGGNKVDIGFLMGVMTLSSVLSRPLVSQMIDKIGRKRSYFFGTIINAVIPALHILFQGSISDFYIPLIALRIVHGIGLGLCFTATLTYVSDIVPKERLNEGLGMFGVTSLVAMAAGPTLAEPIIRNFGFSAYFLTISGLGLSALIMQFFIPETYVRGASTAQSLSFFAVLKRKKILSISIMSAFFGIGMSTQGVFIAPYIQFLGLPNISIFFIAYSTTAVLTRIFGSRLADKVGEENILPWAFLLSAFGYLSLIYVQSSWFLIIPGLIAGCGHGLIFPCLNALAIRGEPIQIRGKISGIFTGAMDGGMFLGAIVSGYIGEWFGFIPIFITTFLVLVTGSGLFLAVLKKSVISNAGEAGI